MARSGVWQTRWRRWSLSSCDNWARPPAQAGRMKASMPAHYAVSWLFSSGRSDGAPCLHDTLAKLFALAFAITTRPIRLDRAWATRRRSLLRRLERSEGRKGLAPAVQIARWREETDLASTMATLPDRRARLFGCARTRPALWEARNGLGFVETPLLFLWFARAI